VRCRSFILAVAVLSLFVRRSPNACYELFCSHTPSGGLQNTVVAYSLQPEPWNSTTSPFMIFQINDRSRFCHYNFNEFVSYRRADLIMQLFNKLLRLSVH